MPSIILSDNGVGSGSAGIKTTGASDGTLALQTTTSGGTATTAMYVDTSQNVGIGTSSPTTVGGIALCVYDSATPRIRLTSSTTGNTSTDGGELSLYGSDFSIENRENGNMNFYTNGGLRARIDSSGNLLVGKTALNDTTTGVQIAGSGATYPGRICATVANSTNATEGIVVYSSAAGAYRFYVSMDGKVNATNTTIAAISDQRLKENIRDLDDGLSSIMALQPRKFDWKAGKGADIKNVRGFIAQEFETVFPDLIDTWKDPAPEGEEPYKSVRADLIPTLVKAIQEQQALIQTLTERISALEAK